MLVIPVLLRKIAAHSFSAISDADLRSQVSVKKALFQLKFRLIVSFQLNPINTLTVVKAGLHRMVENFAKVFIHLSKEKIKIATSDS